MNKPTAVIGASPDVSRYSHKAVMSLLHHGHTVFPVGLRAGNIGGVEIITEKPVLEHVDTVTMYVGEKNQAAWADYIYSLKPRRIIFNPGAENRAFYNEATARGIECVEACTLVMLSIGNY